jgi:hypothetical protein
MSCSGLNTIFGEKMAGHARGAVRESDQWELLSLYPIPLQSVDAQTVAALSLASKPTFGAYSVLGRATLTKDEVKTLRSALLKGLSEGDPGVNASCYNPRHGLVIQHDGTTVEIELCFECIRGEVHGPDGGRFPISRSPLAAFDALVDAHGLMKSPK